MHPEEFWKSIPSEFIKYQKARLDYMLKIEKKTDYRVALISAMIANFSMNKKKGKTYKISDFMPKEKRKMTDEEMFRNFSRVANQWKGGV